MEKVQYGKSETWRKYNMIKVEHGKSVTWKKCNMEKLQYEKVQHGKIAT